MRFLRHAWIFSLLVVFTTGAQALNVASEPANLARILGDAIADTVEEVMPSVVVIRTEAIRYHIHQDILFGRRYRIPERRVGQGSGVIISPEGHMLTSYHVVHQAENIEAILEDGTVYEIELLGGDPHTDLAVLKTVEREDRQFRPIEFGDSDAVRVGEIVIAIGSPYHLDGTVTMGIVSQKGRAIGLLPFEDFIQTQAPINPGNSGGPLVDVEGRMVGINAAIHRGGALQAGNTGIGFAVPSRLAMRVADSIITTGTIQHPWIGILMGVSAEGVTVEDVYRDSPASLAGMQPGDVIREVDGRTIREAIDVRRAIFARAPGDRVPVIVERDGEPVMIDAVLAAMPDLDMGR